MRTEDSGGPRPLFHGWLVVGATSLILAVGFGSAYSFPAFYVPLRDEFDASRGQVSLVFGITGFLYFALGAVSGLLADRYGTRRVVILGVLLMGLGLLLASLAQELWQVYLTYSLGVGVGIGFVYVPAIGAVQRWFVRRRGHASGLAVAGIGIGTLVLPLLALGLIEITHWRIAYAVLGGLTIVLGLAAASLIDDSPARRGLLPDNEVAEPGLQGTSFPEPEGSSVREALHSSPFWLLYASAVAISLGLFMPFAHLAPYAEDQGLPDATGAILVGVIGLGSTIGRFALGAWADRIGRRRSYIGAFVGMGLMLLWWLLATEVWSLAIFALLFGVCYGGFVALAPALTADYFGARRVSSIMGLFFTAAAIGALAGPTLAGVMYDLQESYVVPILFAAAADVIAVGCVLLMAEPAAWKARNLAPPAPAPVA